jgi:hypothetical protein
MPSKTSEHPGLLQFEAGTLTGKAEKILKMLAGSG